MKVWIARDKNGHLGAYKEYPRLNYNGDEYYPNPCTWEHPFGFGRANIAFDLDESMMPDLKFEDGPVEVELSFKPVPENELTPIPEDVHLVFQFCAPEEDNKNNEIND